MKSIFTLILLLLVCSFVFAQNRVKIPLWTFNTDSTTIYGVSVGYMHTDRIESVTTNGLRIEALGFGLLLPLIPNSPVVTSDSLYREVMAAGVAEKINGINLSPLGHGCDCSVNGINVYGAGSIVTKSNGISLGMFMNIAQRHNGIQAAGMLNNAYQFRGLQAAFGKNMNYRFTGIQLSGFENENLQTKGLQISVVNRTTDLKGVQIGIHNKAQTVRGLQLGLWNVNDKRKFPLINW